MEIGGHLNKVWYPDGVQMNGGGYGNGRSKGSGIPTNSGDLNVIYHPTGVQVNGGGNFNGGTTLLVYR